MRDFYDILEFPLIRQRLATFAETPMAHKLALELEIVPNPYTLQTSLEQTDEAMRLISRYGRCSFQLIADIYDSLQKVHKGGQLAAKELQSFLNQLLGIQKIKQYNDQLPGKEFPYFYHFVEKLTIPQTLFNSLKNTLTPEGTIADHATSELYRIRRAIKSHQSEIKERLEQLLNQHREWMNDSIITLRNNRLVLPLKMAYKFSLGGIIHDQSLSGQTAFVEPAQVQSLNIQLNRLEIEENEEIDKILWTFSALIDEHYDVFLQNHLELQSMDLNLAKGAFGISTQSVVACLQTSPSIHLPFARHPLIDPHQVVANTYQLDEQQGTFILITGPNTGGKTVALKTIGLLVVMNQAGLAIPVTGQPLLSYFNSIFVDIGDEQSISQSLSTFSSHMRKIIQMVKAVGSQSLVLLDEIGAGTDPVEGEALAMALFDFLHQKGATVVASTHYSNLKSFALTSGYIRNASMEFDTKDLKPTYRFLPGIPGQSFAFQISKQLGLPLELIEKAQSYKDFYAQSYLKIMEQLEVENRKLAELKAQLSAKETALKDKEIELEKTNRQLTESVQNLDATVQEEIAKAVEKAQAEIDQIVSEIKEKSQDNIKMHEWINAKKRLQEKISTKDEMPTTPQDFQVGMNVFVNSVQKEGTIVRKNGNSYTVTVGAMSIQLMGSELEYRSPTKNAPKATINTVKKPKNVPLEINLIGLRVEESLSLLDKYFDDALLVHHKQVRIIHGHGTGALRKGVHQYLKAQSFVKDFRLGGAGEGGVGATVVTLKD